MIQRRQLLAASLLLGTVSPGSKSLVAYFSRSGNTRVIAGLIQRARHADLFEILPASPYPEDYLATVAQATEERDRGVEPPLASKMPNIAVYDTVYLGFPIWGETAPPVCDPSRCRPTRSARR